MIVGGNWVRVGIGIGWGLKVYVLVVYAGLGVWLVLNVSYDDTARIVIYRFLYSPFFY